MIHFVLDASVRGRVQAWSLSLSGASVRRSSESFAALSACARNWRQRAQGRTPGQIPEVAASRRLYREFGIDPTSTRPSSEALLRRAVKGMDLYQLWNVVDVGNWVSLEFQLPLGLYDARKIEPFDGERVQVRVGHTGEEYAGIRKGTVHVGGRLCVGDRRGAFGSPTSDSMRTCIDETTVDLAAIVFAPTECEGVRLETVGRALATRLLEHAGGTLDGQGLVEDEEI